MTEEPASVTTWGGWILAAITAAGTVLLGWKKQRQAENSESDNRTDAARKEQIGMILTRLEKTELKLDECNEQHSEANSRLASVEERSKRCEEDRTDLKERIKMSEEDRKDMRCRIVKLEETVRP